MLFGSRARGDARPDSDYDVAVFLNDLAGFGAEAAKIAAIETDILYDTGAVINALPLRAGSHRERTGLMHEYAATGGTCDAGSTELPQQRSAAERRTTLR